MGFKTEFHGNIALQGAVDLTTPAVFSKAYFDQISAPVKHYQLIEGSGHEPSDNLLQAEAELLIETLLPQLLKQPDTKSQH